MNPAKLKHVVAVDRFGSFTAAAKAVHITQSAITKSVADIESELGFSLFERHAKGVTTTSEGRPFIDRAARIVADIEQLAADSRAGRQFSSSRIRIGVCPPSLVSILNNALQEMLTQHPQVRIEEAVGWVDQGVQGLKNGDLDLLIGPAPSIRQQSQFVVRELAPFAICFFVRKGHPLAVKRKPKLSELRRYPMALADKSVATPQLTRQLFGASEIPADQQLHLIGHFPSACKIVRATDTVGTVGAHYRSNIDFQKRYTILDIDAIEPVPLVVAYLAKWLPSAPMTTLVKILEEQPHWLEV